MRISEAATGVGEQMADVGLAMQRAVDKTENMKARADAVAELEAAGTFEDLTALGEGGDDIDRQLKELTTGAQVDDELAKMKAELGQGSAPEPAALGEAARGGRGRLIVRIPERGPVTRSTDESIALPTLNAPTTRSSRRSRPATRPATRPPTTSC